ncbi:MAG: pseudouridine synthase [Bacteriovorax sp.]|nr:pseudouridine synthase [Bacteriovorax sp.]
MKTELQRILSKRGIASRTEAAQLIKSGQVKVNGQVCTDPSRGFDPRATIEVFNQKIQIIKKYYLALNKPKGLIVSRSDEKGRPTVYDCLKSWKGPLLQAVGRLDQASEGLLLFTNDHLWSNLLMDPKTHIKKIYHVQVTPIPTSECLEELSLGVIIDDKKTLPANFNFLRSGDKTAWISIELHEGRNRQIRKMFESKKIEVIRLLRVQIGNLEIGPLQKGEWRELEANEIQIYN